MNTLISIIGSTAVGKTSFALNLAKQALDSGQFEGADLISADSRQVYKGLEILSGADIPEGYEIKTDKKIEHDFLEKGSVRIHGVSIIELDQSWSVAIFKNFAIDLIERSIKNNRLPILVGGTGLYHKHLFNRDNNLYVAPNRILRAEAKIMSVVELQNWLQKEDKKKLSSMNNSDLNNPRRLIRAIEIATGVPDVDKVRNFSLKINLVKIGLTTELDTINNKINKRVIERLDNGVLQEVNMVNKLCSTHDLPICTTLGVRDITDYIHKDIDQDECIQNWTLHEFQYAKRQLVWWKKEKDVVWLDDLTKSSYTLVDEKIFK